MANYSFFIKICQLPCCIAEKSSAFRYTKSANLWYSSAIRASCSAWVLVGDRANWKAVWLHGCMLKTTAWLNFFRFILGSEMKWKKDHKWWKKRGLRLQVSCINSITHKYLKYVAIVNFRWLMGFVILGIPEECACQCWCLVPEMNDSHEIYSNLPLY